MRKAYIRIKLPEELTDYIAHIATNRLLGYRSMIEFTAACVRKEVQYLQQLGVVPPVVPKVRTVPAGAIGVLSILLAVALTGLLLTPSTFTGATVLDTVLRPFAGWEPGTMYERYQGFINLTLYFMVFFAIMFAASKRFFERREAILLAAGFALLLSFALALTPVNWVRQLSPAAFLLIALALFYGVLEGLRHFGFPWLASGSLAYILAYLLVRTHHPDVFLAAGPFGAALDLGFLIAFLVAAYQILNELWKRSEPLFGHARRAATEAWSEAFRTPEAKELILKERETLKTMQPQAYRSLRTVESALEGVERAIARHANDPRMLQQLAAELRQHSGTARQLASRLQGLRDLAQRLHELDLDLFTRISKRFDQMSKAEQRKLRAGIKERVAELNLTAMLPKLARTAQDAEHAFEEALGQAISLLEANDPGRGTRALSAARAAAKQLRQLLEQVEATEGEIGRLLQRTVRYFK